MLYTHRSMTVDMIFLQIAKQDFMEVRATLHVFRGIMASPVVGFVIKNAL